MKLSDDRCEHLVRFPMEQCPYCLRARVAELEAMVVWAVKHGAELEGDRVWWFRLLSEDSGSVDIECDGTPASILAAVQQAMKAGTVGE